MVQKDYLDELIESNLERDLRFAAEWPSVEATLSLAARHHKAGLTQQEVADFASFSPVPEWRRSSTIPVA